MIEIFAIGAAAAITGVAAKGLSPLFRSLAPDVTNPAAAVSTDQVAYVPDMPIAEAKAMYGEPVVQGHSPCVGGYGVCFRCVDDTKAIREGEHGRAQRPRTALPDFP